MNVLPGEDTDDETVEHEGRGGTSVEAGGVAGLDSQLADRTGDVAELLQEVGVHGSQQNRHDPTAEISFHSLLGTEDYERCGAEKEATHVGGNVVDGDDGY